MQKCLPVVMTWSFEGHLTCLRPPQPSGLGDFRLYGRSVSQTAMSTFHCGADEVKLVKIYTSFEVFFRATVGKGLAVFLIVSMHLFWLILQSAVPGVIRQLYTHCFCLFWQLLSLLLKLSLWYQELWNLHSPPKRIAYTFKWSYGILDTGKFLGYWIPSMILVRTGLGCQRFALHFIQHVDNFRPCKHTLP